MKLLRSGASAVTKISGVTKFCFAGITSFLHYRAQRSGPFCWHLHHTFAFQNVSIIWMSDTKQSTYLSQDLSNPWIKYVYVHVFMFICMDDVHRLCIFYIIIEVLDIFKTAMFGSSLIHVEKRQFYHRMQLNTLVSNTCPKAPDSHF